MDIKEARIKIEEIDKEMAALFEKRMECAKAIAEYKMENALPIKDLARETSLIERNCSYIGDPVLVGYYKNFLRSTIDISCTYQEYVQNGMRVAYNGIEGAYAQIASTKLFPGASSNAYKSFYDAYKSVEKGDNDVAVLPIENSYAGEIGAVIDLMFNGSLYINNVYDMEISHNLLVKPGTDIKDIKKVYSHQQALDQCARLIKEYGFSTEACSSTANAAKLVSEMNDSTVAAIASVEAGEAYGLQVLRSSVQDASNNTTRFAAFSRSQNMPKSTKKFQDENFILMFTVPNQPGALTQALNILGSHGYNMRSLRSRPLKGLQWNYYFYVEAEGDISGDNGQEMLNELSVICGTLKLIGSYYVKSKEEC